MTRLKASHLLGPEIGTGVLLSGAAPLNPTGDSRLLKVDGRGTCQLCHDPTYTEDDDQYRGPTPTPGVP